MGRQRNLTFFLTIGSWGGFSVGNYRSLGRRVCLGWLAFGVLPSDLPELVRSGALVALRDLQARIRQAEGLAMLIQDHTPGNLTQLFAIKDAARSFFSQADSGGSKP